MIYDVFDALYSRRVAGGKQAGNEFSFVSRLLLNTFFRLFVFSERLRKQTIFGNFSEAIIKFRGI